LGGALFATALWVSRLTMLKMPMLRRAGDLACWAVSILSSPRQCQLCDGYGLRAGLVCDGVSRQNPHPSTESQIPKLLPR
jgi:hypothetical protein